MEFIRTDIEGEIATVTLDHPIGNRINFAMRRELLEAFDHVSASTARVLIVDAKGDDFSLGGDAREWPGIPAAELRPRVEMLAKALESLENLRIPTIAAVQGGCMGGGFELALSCDLIVAGRSARFAFPEARIGIMTLQGGVIQLAERIGRSKAIELVLFSHVVGAQTMETWNVVNRVFDDAHLAAEARAMAQFLAVGPTTVYASTKDLLRTWREEGPKSAKGALYQLSMPGFDRDDTQAALRNAAESMNTGKPLPTAIFRETRRD